MAGDTYLENLTSADLKLLEAAGATLNRTIQHSNRPMADYQDRLTEQLVAGVQNDRRTLPAHAYVTFAAANRDRLNTSSKPTKTERTCVWC